MKIFIWCLRIENVPLFSDVKQLALSENLLKKLRKWARVVRELLALEDTVVLVLFAGLRPLAAEQRKLKLGYLIGLVSTGKVRFKLLVFYYSFWKELLAIIKRHLF